MRRLQVTFAMCGSFALGHCLQRRTSRSRAADQQESASSFDLVTPDPIVAVPHPLQSRQLDESRCHWLLQETGVDIPGWWIRIVLAFTGIASVIGVLLAVATQATGRPFALTLGLSVISGLGLTVVAQITERFLVITETPRSGFWPTFARHFNRWLRLAGPRFTISILAFTLSTLFVSLGARPDIPDLDRSIYAGIVSALWLISGTALATVFFEYRRQLRLLRRSAEPTLVALRNNVSVPPEEVSRLLMSLSYGVAAAHTGSIGLIDASRARSAIAIYSATCSPSSVAPIVEEVSTRLGLAKPMDLRIRDRFAERSTESSDPAERLRASEILGHPTATKDTRAIAFDWLDSAPSVPLPVGCLLTSLDR